jgi:HK97 gp10 family phage protein
MASQISITVDVPDLQQALQEIANYRDYTRNAIKSHIASIAMDVQRGAKRRCPVDTGRLRSSIRAIFSGDRWSVRIGTEVKYAPYMEFGTGRYATNGAGRTTPWVYRRRNGQFIRTVGNKPQPFLYPTWEENKGSFINGLRSILRGENTQWPQR